MANRLKMARVQSILSLHAQGWSGRRIARELGVDRETVSRYVQLEQQSAVRCELEAGGVSKPANAPILAPGSPAFSVPANALISSPGSKGLMEPPLTPIEPAGAGRRSDLDAVQLLEPEIQAA
jgi:transcriptional regulator with XRE-family HTH domain